MAELILNLPGIEGSDPSSLPGDLSDALRKARYSGHRTGDPLASVLGCAALPAPAVLSALGTGIDPGVRHWLRFDVVRMIPDLTAVWIDRPLRFDFDAPAYAALRRELTELLASEGLSEGVHLADGFGLISLHSAAECRFSGLDAAQGGRLDERLPEGPDASRWRRLITASQMLLHRYRALDRADQAGAGLWFWGAGALVPPLPATSALRVVDDFGSATVRGLGRWLGAEPGPGIRPDAEWPERTLACLPLEQADPGAALRELVDNRLQPAMRALRDGRLRRVTVVGSAGVWRLGRAHRIAFWRREVRGLHPGADR